MCEKTLYGDLNRMSTCTNYPNFHLFLEILRVEDTRVPTNQVVATKISTKFDFFKDFSRQKKNMCYNNKKNDKKQGGYHEKRTAKNKTINHTLPK